MHISPNTFGTTPWPSLPVGESIVMWTRRSPFGFEYMLHTVSLVRLQKVRPSNLLPRIFELPDDLLTFLAFACDDCF